MARICLVASEVVGPYKGGGIATSVYGLAKMLSTQHDVEILYAGPFFAGRDIQFCRNFFSNDRIIFRSVREEQIIRHDRPHYISYYCMRAVDSDAFDAIIFHEYGGLGYFFAAAKRQGLAFTNTTLITVMHGPSEWANGLNQASFASTELFNIDFLERRSSEMMDVVTAPSQYIIDWAIRHGWDLRNPRVLRNIVPGTETVADPAVPPGSPRDELIFFGRQEYRKGIFLFCDAVDLLNRDKGVPDTVKITFLGRFSKNSEVHSGEYICRRSAKWRFDVNFLFGADQSEAMEYLTGSSGVAVMPSVEENAPCVVNEAMAAGIPFITTKGGGTLELINPEDHDAVACNHERHELYQLLRAALDGRIVVARPSYSYDDAVNAWRNLISEQVSLPRRELEPLDAPLVSVVLTHFERPHLVRTALRSLREQTYSNFEIILVDDGSRLPSTIQFLDALEAEQWTSPSLKIIRKENNYLGAARNSGAAVAAGRYLMFMDDDNIALPEEIEQLVAVAERTSADIVTCVSKMFSVDHPRDDDDMFDEYVPLGPSPISSISENCFGDANALVRRSMMEAAGGFTTDYGLGFEDFAFFCRAMLQGARFEVVPKPLFWYRVTKTSMLQANALDRFRGNYDRVSRELLEHIDLLDEHDRRRLLRQLTSLRLDEILHATANYTKSQLAADNNELFRLYELSEQDPVAIRVLADLYASNGRIRTAEGLLRQLRSTKPTRLTSLEQSERDQDIAANGPGMLTLDRNLLKNGSFSGLTKRVASEFRPYGELCDKWFLSRDPRPYMTTFERLDADDTFLGAETGISAVRVRQSEPIENGFKDGQYVMLAQNLGPLRPEDRIFRVRCRHRTRTGPTKFNGFIRVRSITEKSTYSDYRFEDASGPEWRMLDKFVEADLAEGPSEAILYINITYPGVLDLECAPEAVFAGGYVDPDRLRSDVKTVIRRVQR